MQFESVLMVKFALYFVPALQLLMRMCYLKLSICTNNISVDNSTKKVNLLTVERCESFFQAWGKELGRKRNGVQYILHVHGSGSALAGSLKKGNKQSSKLVVQMTVNVGFAAL